MNEYISKAVEALRGVVGRGEVEGVDLVVGGEGRRGVIEVYRLEVADLGVKTTHPEDGLVGPGASGVNYNAH